MRICSVFLFVCCILTGSVYSAAEKPSLLASRPVDVGSTQEKKQWIVAIIDRQVRFRLAPIASLAPLNDTMILREIPQLLNYTVPVTDASIITAAQKLGITHVLEQKFELINHDKTINYYAEIVESANSRVVTQVERDIPLDQLSTGIDSCLLQLLPRFGCVLSNEAVRFLTLPVTGTSLKNIKTLGELFCQEGDTTQNRNDISDDYEKLIKKDPFMLLANYSVGMLNFSLGRYDKSSKYIKELLDITPLYTSLYLTLARSYRLEGRFNEALAIALLCERNRLKTVPFLLEKAIALEALKQLGAAFSVYQQVLMLDQRDLTALLYMARIRNDELDFANAKKFAEKALSVDRNTSEGYLEMGRSLIGLNKYSEAKRALAYAEVLQPKNPFTQEFLGDVLMIENRPDSAYTHYQQACALRPVELDLYLKSARALESAGKKTEALALLYEIVTRFPSKPPLRRQIGLLEYATGSLDSATRSLGMYLAVKPDDATALQTLGTAYMELKNFRKAKDFLEKALPVVTDKFTCRLLLAEAELRQGNQGTAMRLLSEIIAEKPVKKAYSLLGEAHLLAGNRQESLKAFKKERELHGNNAPLQEQIAILHYDLAFYAPARKEFETLAALAPENAGAQYHLALLALREGNVQKGEEYFTKAQKLGPGNEAILYQAGQFFIQNRLYPQAIQAYLLCTALNAEHQNALVGLADTYLLVHNDTAAAAIDLRLFRINNTVYAQRLAQAGHLYLRSAQEKAAASAFQLFLDKGFTDQSVNTAYAGILYRANDVTRVIALLKNISGDAARDTSTLLMLSDAYCRTNQHALALPWLAKLRQITTSIRLEARLSAVASEISGDTITAIGMYVRLLAFPPDSQHTNEAYHLGTLYEKRKLIENAIARYEENCKESPDDLRSHERLGALYMQRSDWANAQRVFETAVSFPHVNAAIQKMLARTYAASNNMEQAAALFSVYLVRVKDDLSAWKELTDIYYRRQKYAEAIEPLKQVAALQPDNFEAWYRLGVCHIATDNFTAAIAPLGKARALKPDNLQAIELAARCYRNRNETSTLKSILREWIALDPRRYDIKLEIGSILIAEKEIDEAITMLTDAIRYIPSEAKPHLLLAQAYEFKGNDSLRLVHLKDALRFDPEGWETHYQLARFYLANRLGHDAETHFKKAISLYPTNSKIHHEYSLYLIARNEYERAAEECRLSLVTEPENSFYTILLAFTECMTGKRATAIELTKKALASSTPDARILYWAGRIYKETGRAALARESFTSALALDSTQAPCLESLGDLCMEEIKFKEAAHFFFRSWEKGGYNPMRVYKLGNALFYDHKFAEARDFFETILTKNQRFDDARYRLVAAYCELGDVAKARGQITLFENNETPWMQLAQGTVYEHEGNSKAALVAYSIAQRIAPTHPDVLAGIGRVYMLQHQPDSALMYLSTASATDTLNMQVMIDLGAVFEKTGDSASAVQYYIEVDKKYPQFPEVQARIARIKSTQKAHEIAIRHLERGLQYFPEDTTLHFMLGEEYTFTNQYKEAIEAFKKSLKYGKNGPVEALRLIGDIYYDYMADANKARDYYKKYVKAGGKEQKSLDRLAEK